MSTKQNLLTLFSHYSSTSDLGQRVEVSIQLATQIYGVDRVNAFLADDAKFTRRVLLLGATLSANLPIGTAELFIEDDALFESWLVDNWGRDIADAYLFTERKLGKEGAVLPVPRPAASDTVEVDPGATWGGRTAQEVALKLTARGVSYSDVNALLTIDKLAPLRNTLAVLVAEGALTYTLAMHLLESESCWYPFCVRIGGEAFAREMKTAIAKTAVELQAKAVKEEGDSRVN